MGRSGQPAAIFWNLHPFLRCWASVLGADTVATVEPSSDAATTGFSGSPGAPSSLTSGAKWWKISRFGALGGMLVPSGPNQSHSIPASSVGHMGKLRTLLWAGHVGEDQIHLSTHLHLSVVLSLSLRAATWLPLWDRVARRSKAGHLLKSVCF